MIKVAVIGLGNMGKNHVRNFFEIPEAELVAVCDTRRELAEQYARQYNCKAYTSMEDMLVQETLEAVSITTPTRTHFEVAKRVINAGLHVLVEKPITDSVETADALIQLAADKNVTLMIGHIERFNPGVLKLKEVIDSGALGKINSIIARRVGAFPPQIKDANVIIDLAVHDIDVISHLLGRQPDQVYGNGGRALNSSREDYAELLLTYGDQNAVVQVNWITPIRIRNLSVTGSKGYAEMNYMTQEISMYETQVSHSTDADGDEVIKFGEPTHRMIPVEKGESLKTELTHFLTCAQKGQQPMITGTVGRNALATALDVLKKMNAVTPTAALTGTAG